MIIYMKTREELNRALHSMKGECASCGQEVYEYKVVLDDCFTVWWGKCPYCKALNALDQGPGSPRGYGGAAIALTLPTEEEVIMNRLEDTPTRGWHRPENQGKSREELIEFYS